MAAFVRSPEGGPYVAAASAGPPERFVWGSKGPGRFEWALLLLPLLLLLLLLLLMLLVALGWRPCGRR